MIDPEFIKKAMPLAEYLAAKGFDNPIHTSVLADLYDIVNDVRDRWIGLANATIERYKAMPDFFDNMEKRETVFRLQTLIKRFEGVINNG